MPLHKTATGDVGRDRSTAVTVSRRGAHDHAPAVLGAAPAAHYTDADTTPSGLVVPTRGYVVPAQEYGRPLFGPLFATTDLTTVD